MRHRLAKASLLLALAARPPGPPPAAPPPAARPLAAALREAIDAVVERSSLADARVGICVVSLDTGATLYAHDADVLLNPASNVKLFTAAAALARLGPEYRFETEAWLDAARAGRRRRRAPSTCAARATRRSPPSGSGRWPATCSTSACAGSGDLVLDDGWFDAERIGPGFDQETRRQEPTWRRPARSRSTSTPWRCTWPRATGPARRGGSSWSPTRPTSR